MNNGLDRDTLIDRLINLLQANGYLSELTDEDIYHLAHQAQFEQRQVGEILVRKGDPGDRFYVVIEGQIRISNDLNGNIWVEGYLFEGDFAGEAALVINEPQPVTEDVVVDAVLAVFDQPTFEWLITAAPRALEKLKERVAFLEGQIETSFEGQRYSEAVVLQAKRHFVAFLSNLPGPLIFIILGIIVGFLLFNFISGLVAFLISTCFVGVGLLAVLYLYLDWRNDDFIITSERAIHIERVLLQGETRDEAPLTSVQDVSVIVPNILAKFFDYSDLHIQTAGAGTIVFDGLKRINFLRDEIFRQRQKAQERVEASNAEAVRLQLKRVMGVNPEPDRLPPVDSGEAHAAKKPGYRLPRAINFFIPRVQEVKGDDIIWRKNLFVFLNLVAGPLIAAVVLAYFILAALFGFFPFLRPNQIWIWLTLIGWPIVLFWYSFQYDIWRKDEYQLTSTSIIDYKGSAFNLQGEQRRVGTFDVIQNSTYVTPNFIAKLLNIGHVVIETAGTEMTFTFAWVYNPSAIQQEVFKRWLAHKENKTLQDRAYEEQRLVRWLGAYHELLTSPGSNDNSIETNT